jgi:hypothetical protein
MQAAPAPVLYDHRETNSGVPEALAALGIHVRAEQLPAGDYVLSDRLVVERKTGADLAASIKDRRLFEQVDRLTGAYAAVVLIVEGEPQHISEASWMGALARVLLAGVAIVRADDAEHTARWLLRLYRVEGKGPSASRGLPRARRPTDDLERVAEDVLSCVPGISAWAPAGSLPTSARCARCSPPTRRPCAACAGSVRSGRGAWPSCSPRSRRASAPDGSARPARASAGTRPRERRARRRDAGTRRRPAAGVRALLGCEPCSCAWRSVAPRPWSWPRP